MLADSADVCKVAVWLAELIMSPVNSCLWSVSVLTRMVHIIHVQTCNPACTELLMNFDHKPKPMLVWPGSVAL